MYTKIRLQCDCGEELRYGESENEIDVHITCENCGAIYAGTVTKLF